MTQFLFIYILLIHYLGDFALQTDYMALNKGSGKSFYNHALLCHVGVYTLVWFIAVAGLGFSKHPFYFAMITFFFHYCTDWISSRMTKPRFEAKNYRDAFIVIGMDQILHYLQLYFTFKLLM